MIPSWFRLHPQRDFWGVTGWGDLSILSHWTHGSLASIIPAQIHRVIRAPRESRYGVPIGFPSRVDMECGYILRNYGLVVSHSDIQCDPVKVNKALKADAHKAFALRDLVHAKTLSGAQVEDTEKDIPVYTGEVMEAVSLQSHHWSLWSSQLPWQHHRHAMAKWGYNAMDGAAMALYHGLAIIAVLWQMCCHGLVMAPSCQCHGIATALPRHRHCHGNAATCRGPH